MEERADSRTIRPMVNGQRVVKDLALELEGPVLVRGRYQVEPALERSQGNLYQAEK
ncbi:hypothetical protein ACFL5M_01445 [Candidatus Neomarinimicrobiota bacterium]